MKLRKIVSTILVVAIFATQLSWVSFVIPSVSYAVEKQTSTNIATKYFYNQLTEDAKVFYHVMDKMFFENDYTKLKEELQKTGTKFGVDSYDMTQEINQSESLKAKLQAYTQGNQDLLNTMGAARDAYKADHAGIFYIDFDNLSLRVLKSSDDLKVFLGIGRSETYINKAFWNETEKKVDVEKLILAFNEVEKVKNEQLVQIRKVVAQEGQNLKEQQIRKAHDLVIKMNSYKLEEDIIEDNKKIMKEEEKGDPWNVRTVYGAFGPKHQIVCEGYARAFKMLLDDLNIPCILVNGAYSSGNIYEEHMWTYVQLDNGKWYAVDVTFDNTDEMIDSGYEGQIEKISTEYFLAGDDKMSLHHIPTGIMSVANYKFTYPALETTSDKYEVVSENEGLKVELDDENYDKEDEIVASKFKVSYAIDLNKNGVIDSGERMGFKKAKEHGYYMVIKFSGYYEGQEYYGQEGQEGWGTQDYFGYVSDIFSSLVDVADEDDPNNSHLEFYNANSQCLQFGITTIPPMDPKDVKVPSDIEKATTFFGTSADLVAMSDLIHNPNGTYVAAPYVKRITPMANSTMYIGSSYHCVIEYDDILVPTNGLENVGIEIDIRKSSNKEKNKYTLENFKFDGKSTFEFDFKPSELYADDSIFYDITFTGVVGKASGKSPMPTGYFCAHRCEAYAYKSQGFDWNVYGKPSLMDDVNLDNLTEEESSDLADLLKHRLTLVTTTTKPSEKKVMEDLLNNPETTDEKTGEKLNINGTVEKTETYNITLTLCKKQKIQNGQAVRIMLGFPEGYGPEDAGVTFKAYHYIKDQYGNITGVEEIPCMVTELGLVIECSSFSPFTIATIKGEKEEAKTRTVLFQSSDGGTVKVDGTMANKVTLDETNTTSKTITIKPEQGYVVDDIVIGEQVIDVNGDDAKQVTVNKESNEITYVMQYSELKNQNCEAMVAKVAFIPEITKEAEKEEGLEVVAQPMVQPSFEVSAIVNKIVKGSDGSETKESAQTLSKGDEIEITYKLDSVKAVGEKGILGIGALLSYNKDALQYKDNSLKGENGWNIKFNSTTDSKNHNIVGTYKLENEQVAKTSQETEQIGNIFTLRFIVLQEEDATEIITLKNIDGGTGESVPKAPDVNTNITIQKHVEDQLFTTQDATCRIKDNIIIDVELGTTIEQLSQQLSSGSDKPVKYYGHKITQNSEGNSVVQNLDTVVELTGSDLISTGTMVKVGEKTWTIAVRGDLDGDGSLSINDITLFKLDYIEEEALTGIYLEAAEIDSDAQHTVNDLVKMVLYYNGEEKSLR